MTTKLNAVIFILLALLVQGCGNITQVGAPHQELEASPLEVSEAFYAWYLNAFGDHESNTFGSPLFDKKYHNSPYLTPSFIGHVDEIVAGLENQSGYDPFLCAHNIPEEVRADGIFWHGGGASVVIRTSFPGHFITLDLQKIGDEWKIGDITCPFSPEGTAKGFYTWYLAYIGDPATDAFRNPLVEKAYRECGFLSAKFIQELDDQTANDFPADPILMTQDIPQDFTVGPGLEKGTAIVHLKIETETFHHLKVSMVPDLGTWKIDGISEAK